MLIGFIVGTLFGLGWATFLVIVVYVICRYRLDDPVDDFSDGLGVSHIGVDNRAAAQRND